MMFEPSLTRLAACRFLPESSSVFFSKFFFGYQCWPKLVGERIILIDLMSHDDRLPSCQQRSFWWVLSLPNKSQPLDQRKGAVTIASLLRSVPAHLVQWLLGWSLPLDVVDVGLPSSYPKCLMREARSCKLYTQPCVSSPFCSNSYGMSDSFC